MANKLHKGATKPEGTPPKIPHKVTINETAQIAPNESRLNFKLPVISSINKPLPKLHSDDTTSSKLSSKMSMEGSKVSSRISSESPAKVSTDFIVSPMIGKKKLSDSPAKIIDKSGNKIPGGKKAKSDSTAKGKKGTKSEQIKPKETKEEPKEPKRLCGHIECVSSCSCSTDCTECDHGENSSNSIEGKPLDIDKSKKDSDSKGEKSISPGTLSNNRESSSSKKDLPKSQPIDEPKQDSDLINRTEADYSRAGDTLAPRSISKEGQENIYTEVDKNEEIPSPCCCDYEEYDDEEDSEDDVECLCAESTAEDDFAIEFLRCKINQMEMEMNYQQQNITKLNAQLSQLEHGMTIMETFHDEMSINLSYILNCICVTHYQMRQYIDRISMQKLFRIIDRTLYKYITQSIHLETTPPSTKEYLKLKIMLHIAGNIIISKEGRSYLPTEPLLDFIRNLTVAIAAFQTRPFGEEMEGTILKIMYNFSLEKAAIVILQRQVPVLISISKYICLEKQSDKKFFGLQFAKLLTRTIPEKHILDLMVDNLPMRRVEALSEHADSIEMKCVAEDVIKNLGSSNSKFLKYGAYDIPYYKMNLAECRIFNQESFSPIGKFEDRMCAKYEDIDRSRKLKGSIISFNAKLESLTKDINLMDKVNSGSLDQIADSLSKFQFKGNFPVYTESYPYHYTVRKANAPRSQKSSTQVEKDQRTPSADHEITDQSDDYKSASSKPHTSE